MKISIFNMFALSLVWILTLHAEPADLVKICQIFKITFLETCQLIDQSTYTNEIKFLKENLTTDGSVIFYGVICKAIDDCITLLSNQDNPETEELCKKLTLFKNQINSDFMYDLNTGSIIKREITKSGSVRVLHLPYNATRCYKILC
jgi:hypothetical protein